MTERPDVPEVVRDAYERRVAITIAVIAAILAVVGVMGDDARLKAQLAATRESDQWAFYQSKSVKGHNVVLLRDILSAMSPSAVDGQRRSALLKRAEDDLKKYEHDKEEAEKEARHAHTEVEAHTAVNDRCDLAGVMLQIAIVVSSVAILVRWPVLWWLGMVLGLFGVIKALSVIVLQ